MGKECKRLAQGNPRLAHLLGQHHACGACACRCTMPCTQTHQGWVMNGIIISSCLFVRTTLLRSAPPTLYTRHWVAATATKGYNAAPAHRLTVLPFFRDDPTNAWLTNAAKHQMMVKNPWKLPQPHLPLGSLVAGLEPDQAGGGVVPELPLAGRPDDPDRPRQAPYFRPLQAATPLPVQLLRSFLPLLPRGTLPAGTPRSRRG